MDLLDAHVVITGASRGIGAALARRFAEAGASLTLVARNGDTLAALADELGCAYIAGDLLNEDFVDGLIAKASERAAVDVLVNNAGMEQVGHVGSQSPMQIRNVLRLNLEVPSVLTQNVLGSMLEGRRGHIVNVSSMAMAVNTPGFATYGASKSGLSSFTGALAQELSGTGVDVTIVEIGTADTDMFATLRSSDVQGVFARYEKLGMNPLLDVDDVATAICTAVQYGKRTVRLPLRQAVLPMIVNAPRAIGNALTRGVSTAQSS